MQTDHQYVPDMHYKQGAAARYACSSSFMGEDLNFKFIYLILCNDLL